jgi:hypothetical protein
MVSKRLIYSLILVFLCVYQGLTQDLKFSEIRPLELVNSEAEEILPLVSPDGKVLYFSRIFSKENVGGDFAGSDIWWSEASGDLWLAPQRAPNSVNNRDNNGVIGLNSNGNIVYLMNAYKRNQGISFVEGEPSEWSKPGLIPIEGIDSERFIGYYVSPDYSVMVLSMEVPGSRGKEDLFVCLRDSISGQWGELRSLGSTINTAGFEIAPYLSKDKQYLFFASDGHGGYGDADIFVSRRLYDRWDVWSAPVNLGEGINSPYFDAYLSIGNDSLVYFASNRNGAMSDIFQARLEVRESSARSMDAQKIIAEAEAILNELRETNVKEEELIIFEPFSSELNDEARRKLRQLINRLKYDEYTSFHLLTVDPEGSVDEALRRERVDVVKNFISLLGVGGKNIFDYPATQQVTLKDGTVFNSAEGMLIIVKD